MFTVLAFDIETVPDLESGRRLMNCPDLSDNEVADLLFAKSQQKKGTDFQPLHLQKVVAISVALKHAGKIRVWTLGDEDSTEKEIIQRFFDGVERYQPTLVTWNGSGFDLPVLHYRALLHGVDAKTYWEVGDNQRDYKYNNYIGRFHWRHIDLMDVLAAYQFGGRAPLDEIAVMLGFPGKLGMSGDKVWPAFRDGKLKDIRDYCETDALNTYLVYLRFEFMRRNLDQASYDAEITKVKDFLHNQEQAHFVEFLDVWNKN